MISDQSLLLSTTVLNDTVLNDIESVTQHAIGKSVPPILSTSHCKFYGAHSYPTWGIKKCKVNQNQQAGMIKNFDIS